MTRAIALLCLSFASFANALSPNISAPPAPLLGYTIIAERNHDSRLFTEGLLIHRERFYESNGRYAKSSLVSYPVAETGIKTTAAAIQHQALPAHYFAEGLTLFGNKLYQLTWKEQTLFIYDAITLKKLNSLTYRGEGWGLTATKTHLIRSDGSDKLYFHNPVDFTIEKTISVRLNQKPIRNLNELEYIDGFIWSNIWQDNRILKINAATGEVVGVLDLSAIVKRLSLSDEESVLNGIAYDENRSALWVTGKYWPSLFLIKIN